MVPDDGVSAPDPDFQAQIHSRLIDRDPVAPEELATAFLVFLADRLARKYPNIESHLIDTAVIDAVLAYIERPNRFDPGKASLSSYLVMSAEGDLRNSLRREKRISAVELPIEENVELSTREGNTLVQGRDEPELEPEGLPESVAWDKVRQRVEDAIADDRDRQFISLMLSGERRTSVFVEVLGIEGLSPKEQQQQVKRNKDRLLKRLERLKRDLDGLSSG